MDNGFPPRTFPAEAVRAGTAGGPGAPGLGAVPPGPPRRRRRPWIAVGAVLIALLLVAAGLALANRDDDDGADLAADGTTTTIAAIDTSVPTFDTTTSLETTTTSVEPVTTTVAPEVPATTVAAGVLETSVPTLAIPRVNAATGPQSARLTLRNTGPGPLAYTTQSTLPGLSARPARGTIAAGGMTELTVSLDGSRVRAEGPFTGTLTIGGTGGVKTVQVTSVVGRPPTINDDVGEPCATPGVPCSRQIKLAPPVLLTSSPCTNPWAFSVRVSDQSQIQSVRATAQIGLALGEAPLLKDGQSSGTTGTFRSAPIAPVPAGFTLRFFIEASDQLGFSIRLAEQTIVC
jgi:hypothetical protein